MRATTFAILSISVVAIFAFNMFGVELTPLSYVHSSGDHDWSLSSLKVAAPIIWLLLLLLAFRRDQFEIGSDIGSQRGREAAAKLKQKSINRNDRYESFEQQVETSTQRQSLRKRIAMRAVPYILLTIIAVLAWYGTDLSFATQIGGIK